MGITGIRPGRVLSISAVSNPRIKGMKALWQKKYRDNENVFLVEGAKLVRDALELGWNVKTIAHTARDDKPSEGTAQLAAMARSKGADVLEVPHKVLASITRRDNPQSVVATMEQRWGDPPKGKMDRSCVWIGLDRVRDPGNLGTIIRTADACGVSGIFLIADTTDPYSFEASRASMGSIFNMPLVRMDEASFMTWRTSHWQGMVCGTHLDGTQDYRLPDYGAKPVLLLMGNEQQGLSKTLTKACDTLVKIPMSGSADSLNLAISTGVMLFEMGKHLPPINKEPLS